MFIIQVCFLEDSRITRRSPTTLQSRCVYGQSREKYLTNLFSTNKQYENDRIAHKLQWFRCPGIVFGIWMYAAYNSRSVAVVAYLLLIALSRFVFKTIRISIENSWICYIDTVDHMPHPVVPSSISDYYQVYTHTIILFPPFYFSTNLLFILLVQIESTNTYYYYFNTHLTTKICF